MKNTLSNKLKFLKLLEHKLKVELQHGYHSSVNDIDDLKFLNGGLSDKDRFN